MQRRTFLRGLILAGAGLALPSRGALVLGADTDIDTVLSNASQRLKDTQSMAFTMEIKGSTWVDDKQTIRLLGAKGVMARPNAVDVQFTAEVLGTNQIDIRMITIGDDSWITDLVTGAWVPAPSEFGFNPAVLYDDQAGLGPVMGKITDPQLDGDEKIDDITCQRVIGRVDEKTIAKLTASTMRGKDIALTLWVDPDTWNIRQIELVEPDEDDIDDPATWIMHLSKHNEDVTIEKPV